jgi:hypothetical protein
MGVSLSTDNSTLPPAAEPGISNGRVRKDRRAESDSRSVIDEEAGRGAGLLEEKVDCDEDEAEAVEEDAAEALDDFL